MSVVNARVVQHAQPGPWPAKAKAARRKAEEAQRVAAALAAAAEEVSTVTTEARVLVRGYGPSEGAAVETMLGTAASALNNALAPAGGDGGADGEARGDLALWSVRFSSDRLAEVLGTCALRALAAARVGTACTYVTCCPGFAGMLEAKLAGCRFFALAPAMCEALGMVDGAMAPAVAAALKVATDGCSVPSGTDGAAQARSLIGYVPADKARLDEQWSKNIRKRRTRFLPFEAARQWARAMHLETEEEWAETLDALIESTIRSVNSSFPPRMLFALKTDGAVLRPPRPLRADDCQSPPRVVVGAVQRAQLTCHNHSSETRHG